MAGKDSSTGEKDLSAEKAAQLLKLLEALGMSPLGNGAPKDHAFWKTQPVPKSAEEVAAVKEDGPILPEAPKIPELPYKLPGGYKWATLDIEDEAEKADLYLLLNQNYVEDYDSKFRFDYPPNFLEWALKPPGWNKEWNVAVRSTDGTLVAFISAIPTNFRVRSSEIKAVEVNFLCIHKRLRAQRLAPTLIKEVTRRVNLAGCFQALYTAGVQLPEPIGTARYFHRPLNYQKLCETGFTMLPTGLTMSFMNEKFKVSQDGLKLREMTEADIGESFEIFQTYTGKFDMVPIFSREEFAHWMLPRSKVVYSYVYEDVSTGKITDFASFYSLPSSVLDSDKHSNINVGYLFYYGSSTDSSKHLESLIKGVLLKAKEECFDVFNALDIMENSKFVKKLGFAPGDGSLHYYLYNWKTTGLDSENIGVCML